MELLVDTGALIDLAVVDALDFLLGHSFFVSAELHDLLDKSDPAAHFAGRGDPERYRAAVDRLRAFRANCNEPPVTDGASLLKCMSVLQVLQLDYGEHGLCGHVPLRPGSVLVTSDLDALRKIAGADPDVRELFEGRCWCFEEVAFHLLAWKPYADLKDDLYGACWRREGLRDAFFARGPATTEDEFRAVIGAIAKRHAKTHAPLLQCSW